MQPELGTIWRDKDNRRVRTVEVIAGDLTKTYTHVHTRCVETGIKHYIKAHSFIRRFELVQAPAIVGEQPATE